jgi:uncharacterized protein (DUF1330 family)
VRGANYTARLAVGQFTAKRAPGVIPLLQKHGVEILVADYEPKTLEGESRGVNVVLRFESEEAAMAWYHDPDYEPVKKIRLDSSSRGTLTLAKQFVPPSG